MTDSTPNPPNHSLDRRREERAVEHLMQDSASRLSELATTQMEVWQKQMALGSQVASYWSDTFNIAQQSFSRIIDTVQQQRRSA